MILDQFRDLKTLNMALLSKQALRLLIARVHKIKYFPNSTFLKASTSSSGSWIWERTFD